MHISASNTAAESLMLRTIHLVGLNSTSAVESLTRDGRCAYNSLNTAATPRALRTYSSDSSIGEVGRSDEVELECVRHRSPVPKRSPAARRASPVADGCHALGTLRAAPRSEPVKASEVDEVAAHRSGGVPAGTRGGHQRGRSCGCRSQLSFARMAPRAQPSAPSADAAHFHGK